jgi:hypothetical protein
MSCRAEGGIGARINSKRGNRAENELQSREGIRWRMSYRAKGEWGIGARMCGIVEREWGRE